MLHTGTQPSAVEYPIVPTHLFGLRQCNSCPPNWAGKHRFLDARKRVSRIIWLNPPRTTRPATMPQLRGLSTSSPHDSLSDCAATYHRHVSSLSRRFSIQKSSFSIQTQMRTGKSLTCTTTTIPPQPNITGTRQRPVPATGQPVSNRL